MRYILDSEGYVDEVSFGGLIECKDKSCTEYTGTIPEGYETLLEWADNANVRAYKIVEGNLVYDSNRDAEIQAQAEIEEEENACATHKYVRDIVKNNNEIIVNNNEEIAGLYPQKTVKGTLVHLKESSNFKIPKVKITLPEEYQEVEYIESTGTQYIRAIEEIDKNQKIKYEANVKFTATNNNRQLIGNYYGRYFGITADGYLEVGSDAVSDISGLNWNYIDFEYNNTNIKCIINNETELTRKYTMSGSNIFGINIFACTSIDNNSPTFNSGVQLKKFKIYLDDVLTRDFIPCYRKSDDVIGLYDLVNGIFYTNKGSGTFLKGNDVSFSKDVTLISTNRNIIPNTAVSTSKNGVDLTVNEDRSMLLRGKAEVYNLLDFRNAKSGTHNGVTITPSNDGTYAMNGTATHLTMNVWFFGGYKSNYTESDILFTLPAGTYYIRDVMLFKGIGSISLDKNGERIVTITEDYQVTGIRAKNAIANQTYNNEVCYPMIVKTSEPKPFISYDTPTTFDICGNAENTKPLFYLKKNIDYYLNSSFDFEFYNYDGTDRTLVGTFKDQTFKVTDNDKPITHVVLTIPNGTEVDTTIFVQLEYGKEFTKYVKHLENTQVFTVTESQNVFEDTELLSYFDASNVYATGEDIEIEVTYLLNSFYDKISGTGKLELPETFESQFAIQKLSIKGFTQKALFPSSTLYPGASLYPQNITKSNYNLVVDSSTEETANKKTYALDTYLLVGDEIVYENNIIKVIRADGSEEELISEAFLPTFNGYTYMYIEGEENLNYYCEYMLSCYFNDVYCTREEKNASMKMLEDSITLEVNKKVGFDEIVAKLNVAVENGQGVILLKGNAVIIDADFFKLFADGIFEATGGNIAGWEFDNKKFFRNFIDNGVNYQSGLCIPQINKNSHFIYGGLNIDESESPYDAELEITHGGYVKGSSFNAWVGYTLRHEQEGNNALAVFPKQISWYEDTDEENNTLYEIRILDDNRFRFYLENGEIFEIYDRNNSNSLMRMLRSSGTNTATTYLGTDLRVTGYRTDGINNSIYNQGYEVLTTASDERLKENIVDSTDNALDTINKIKVRSFDWRKDKHLRNGGQHINNGFIAQEVQEIDETLVNHNKENDTYQMELLNIVALHTKSIQELSKQIEELKDEINKLKGVN